MAQSEYETLKHNFIANLLDGSFFGLGIGFASFITVIPLFVSQLTDSAVLIGLIPAIHTMGWQLPQLLTVNHVSRQSRYKPTVVLMALQERLPFLGLAVVAWMLPGLTRQTALVLTFALLIWHGLGGGVTATAWQAMIGKIMPPRRVGMFYGLQSAAANLLAGAGAIGAGVLLERLQAPGSFAVCFLIAGLSMAASWVCLSTTREPSTPPPAPTNASRSLSNKLLAILRRDANFRWFLVVRMLSQIAMMAVGFYTIFAVRRLGMDVLTAGAMTAVLSASQVAANPVMGWVGDRWGHRAAMQIGAISAAGSALIAIVAPSVEWFYLAFALAGIANVAFWTVTLAMTLEFESGEDRPAYIGLANSLVAPVTMLAPVFGGWLADAAGYPAMFLVSVVGGLATALVVAAALRDPRRLDETSPAAVSAD
ncbi:MAG: MFS transporter [Chloroflexi bacterium]|nr:MFS transporter [Chloroflexota bacterium]